MFTRIAVATINILIVLLFVASTALCQGNVGISYSRILDDQSIGLVGAYTTNLSDRVLFDADVKAQAGDVYNANLQTDFTFDIATVNLRLLIENKIKGYALDTLGRQQSIGLAFQLPVDNLNFDVGIGGVNASPFGEPSAYDTLLANGFTESAINGKGLESLSPEPRGIPFKAGNQLNVFIETGFTKGFLDVDIKGIVELLGEGKKQQQCVIDLSTSGKVYQFDLKTGLEIGLLRLGDTIYTESAIISTIGFDF